MNANNAVRRIKREVDDFLKFEIPGLSIQVDPSNAFRLTAFVDGPSGSVYEEGRFQLDIHFPQEYPFKPPLVRFKTQVFHPNVDGENICLDILKDQWSPALKIQQVIISLVLLSISSFLVDPCPENGYGNQATQMMKTNIEEFNKVAREWTQKYAAKQT